MSKLPVEIVKRYALASDGPRRHEFQDYSLVVHMEPNECIEVAIKFDRPFANTRWMFAPQFVETQLSTLVYSIQFRARDQCKIAFQSPFKAPTEVCLILFFIGECDPSLASGGPEIAGKS